MAVTTELSTLHRLDDLTPLAAVLTPEATEIHVLDDTPHDPSLWRDAGAEELGGFQGGYHR